MVFTGYHEIIPNPEEVFSFVLKKDGVSMDEIIFGGLLKTISIVAIIVGVLTGVDLLSGAKVLGAFNKLSNTRLC